MVKPHKPFMLMLHSLTITYDKQMLPLKELQQSEEL